MARVSNSRRNGGSQLRTCLLLHLGLAAGYFNATWCAAPAGADESGGSTLDCTISINEGGACEIRFDIQSPKSLSLPLKAYSADLEESGFDNITAKETVVDGKVTQVIKGSAIDIFPVLRILHGARPMFTSPTKLSLDWDGELLSVSFKGFDEVPTAQSKTKQPTDQGRLIIQTAGRFLNHSVGEMSETRQRIEIESWQNITDLSFTIGGLRDETVPSEKPSR